MLEESPVKDPWIVFVRTDDPEKVEREAGLRGARVDNGVGFVFYDDEKASALARHLTKKGHIVIYGPEPKVAAERASQAQERVGIIREQSPKERTKLENLAWRKTPQKMRARINQERVVMIENTCVTLSAMEDSRLQAYTHGKRRGGVEEAPFATVDRDPKVVDAGKKWGNMGSPRAVYDALQESMNRESQEVFLVIPVDLHGDPCSPPVEVARGQRDRVSVDNSDVMRPVAKHIKRNVVGAVVDSNCSGFVVAHNHPSGHAKPSDADISLTKSIREAAKPFHPVVLLDHVIIGRREFYSIGEGKLYRVK